MIEQGTETLGAYLRRERERRNISIEQLAYATRIGIKMLRSLEEDLHDELPALPFVRGYLQAYGKYVGLDTQDLFLRYQHHLATHPDSKKATLRSHYVYMKERYQERKQLFFILSLCVTMIACAGAYFMLKTKRDHAKATAKQIALKETTIAADTTQSAETNTIVAAAQDQNKPAASTKTNPTATVPAIEPAHKTTTPEPKTDVAAKNEANTEGTAKKFNLSLKSSADAWLRFQTDSDVIKDLTLHTGHSVTLRANKVIKLFSGNLGALQASMNGHEIKSLIQPGRAMSAVLPEAEIPNYPLPLFPPMTPAASQSSAPAQSNEPDDAPSADAPQQ